MDFYPFLAVVYDLVKLNLENRNESPKLRAAITEGRARVKKWNKSHKNMVFSDFLAILPKNK